MKIITAEPYISQEFRTLKVGDCFVLEDKTFSWGHTCIKIKEVDLCNPEDNVFDFSTNKLIYVVGTQVVKLVDCELNVQYKVGERSIAN